MGARGTTYAFHGGEIWALLIGLPFGYLFFGVPAMLVFGWLGKNMQLVSEAYDSLGYGLAALIFSTVVVGLILWKMGDVLIWFVKGVFCGLGIRACVQLVRTIMGQGPDPYTGGWLYRIVLPVVDAAIDVMGPWIDQGISIAVHVMEVNISWVM